MVVISRRLDRYVTELSAGCKQSKYPETVAPQDASSSTEQSVADMALATTISKTPPQRIAKPNSPPVKVPNERADVRAPHSQSTSKGSV